MERRLGYRPALDGVRGAAILMVVAGHAFHIGQGGLGVDVFFVLSGFLITSLLLEERARSGRVSLRTFYVRRARRLLPAVAVYALVFAVVEAAVAPEKFTGWAVRALGAIFYVGNVLRAYGISQPVWPFGQFWSLAAEEQFYLVWPAVLIGLLAWRTRWAAWFAAATVVASSALALAVYWTSGDALRVWFGPDTHLAPIAVGCLLALTLERGDWIARLWPYGLAVATVIVFTPLGGRWLFDGPFEVFPLAVAAVLAGAVGSTRMAWWLSDRRLVWVGGISYSLYLWHLPALILGPIGLPLAFAAAYVSRRWVERPFLRRRDSGLERGVGRPLVPAAVD